VLHSVALSFGAETLSACDARMYWRSSLGFRCMLYLLSEYEHMVMQRPQSLASSSIPPAIDASIQCSERCHKMLRMHAHMLPLPAYICLAACLLRSHTRKAGHAHSPCCASRSIGQHGSCIICGDAFVSSTTSCMRGQHVMEVCARAAPVGAGVKCTAEVLVCL